MSKKIAVIVGAGGINPKGRTAGHGGYFNHIADCLNSEQRIWAEADLRSLMKAKNDNRSYSELLKSTGIREYSKYTFDYKNFKSNKKLSVSEVEMLPDALRNQQLFKEVSEQYPISFGGQIPSGFAPEDFYNSRSHPKGLALAIFAASEALMDAGISIDFLRKRVPPNRMAVYAGSAIGQLGQNGGSNYTANRFRDERISPRALAMALAQAPADFISSYIFGSLGRTGHMMGACATLIYQMAVAIDQIHSNQIDYALVGAAEAPLNHDIMDAFMAQNGAGTDAKLLAVQEKTNQTTERLLHHTACRPFGENIGVVLGESSHYFLLMSDELAIETGANIKSVIGGAHINADGFKASLPKPGAGNYLSLGYALGSINKLQAGNLNNSAVIAHGTGTPLNRTTESDVLSKTAKGFGIKSWPVSAPKGALGHSMASASGDGLAYALGMLEHHVLPGISSTPSIAQDVVSDNLDFILENKPVDPASLDWVLINAKGFGGNNASCSVSSQKIAMDLLKSKYSQAEMNSWRKKNEQVNKASKDYNQRANSGDYAILYKFNHAVIDGEFDINVHEGKLNINSEQQLYPSEVDLNDV